MRRITPSQFASKMRQLAQRQRQEVDRYNRELRAAQQKINNTINNLNREIRVHNARVRADRQRLRSELVRLQARQPTTRYTSLRVSVTHMQAAYDRLEHRAELGDLDDRFNDVLDLSEREAANSAQLMNALLADPDDSVGTMSLDSPLTPLLIGISEDLADRWKGALYSLSPTNPDAARHFCTSAREVISQILDVKAPDAAVVAALPDCERTPQRNTPTRRAKIRYFLHRKGLGNADLEAFVEDDMNNVVELFAVFNEGTHGSAGRFSFSQLQAIRKRVEDGVMFLGNLIGH